MTRAILENLFLFFLPTLLYFGWLFLVRPESLKKTSDDRIDVLHLVHHAPLVWLGIAGAVCMIMILMTFGSSSGGKPGQLYNPPIYKDGQIIPGNIQ